MERHAEALRIALTVRMPGILQTEDHARAVLEAVALRLRPSDIDLRVAHRMDHQQVLERADPPNVALIIHEAALRMEIGPRPAPKSEETKAPTVDGSSRTFACVAEPEVALPRSPSAAGSTARRPCSPSNCTARTGGCGTTSSPWRAS
ncbi:hypothetical protein HHL19_22365 [Streptomyces sp. R302]|uniref:Scr1 family TA system antitoxin-like transcriptional regulator n=1 Tax=unclassified Streptomyces TaxID=2593676 RepID=UPI00145C9DB4|nr:MULTISPECIES: Scr1 family TA system antitoxin-like transcriptional regulator [unclassified Streptomyces]NML51706.1 hypothetical protein [Streptomyces sp. R301]NML81326.1 hypothetical protein [Streptomyces sp. R302]